MHTRENIADSLWFCRNVQLPGIVIICYVFSKKRIRFIKFIHCARQFCKHYFIYPSLQPWVMIFMFTDKDTEAQRG